MKRSCRAACESFIFSFGITGCFQNNLDYFNPLEKHYLQCLFIYLFIYFCLALKILIFVWFTIWNSCWLTALLNELWCLFICQSSSQKPYWNNPRTDRFRAEATEISYSQAEGFLANSSNKEDIGETRTRNGVLQTFDWICLSCRSQFHEGGIWDWSTTGQSIYMWHVWQL